MNMFLETHGDHEIFKLKGELKVHLIPEISPQLLKFITVNQEKNLVLDMSAVDFIDSSTIRMLINLHKRLEPQKKKLCLLSPSVQVKKIIEDVKLQTVFTIFPSSEELERETTDALQKAYREFTIEKDGLRKLICSCPVCGSNEVQGYLVDENAYNWTWEKDGLFPISMTKDTKTPLDVFSILPIVCTTCYMSSLNVAHFHATSGATAGASGGEEPPAIAARLSETVKQQLSKSIKLRKKIMESCVVIADDFFNHPRKKIASYYCLLLAESCARSMAAAKMAGAPFLIGYINYLAIQYAGHAMKEELINSIRTWMNQVVADKGSYRTNELARAYFILFSAAFSLEKHKEAAKILEDFSSFAGSIPQGAAHGTSEINSVGFWLSQAQRIGEKLASVKS
jgi:anti-sigma B factor antagonist